MSKSDALRVGDYLAHIVEAIDRIDRYVDDMTELTFLSDEKTQDAVVRNFEILGARLPTTLKSSTPTMPKSTPMCPGR